MELNIVGPCTTQTSYGIVTLNLVKELSRDHTVSLFPIGQTEHHPHFPIDKELKRGRFPNRDNFCVRIFHQHSLDLFCGRSVGLPIFELDRFTPQERHSLNSCEKLISCSKWARETVLKDANKESDVVPLGVDLTLFKPAPTFNKRPVFLHVGKVEVRKHSKEIVDLFAEEFKDDDVELWLAWDNIFTGNDDWNRYALQKLGSKVKIMPRMDYLQVPKIMQAADAVISLSSAEGWNLPILEGMACGKWCIATNCTGQTEFIDSSVHQVEVDEMDWAFDGVFFDGKVGKWYIINEQQEQQFKTHLRSIYNKIKSGEVNHAAHRRAQEFSWYESAKKLVACLN
jgi:glycosyltransferase involved in cell wall biosynthesis